MKEKIVKRREVWHCDLGGLGFNVGSEQSGERPVLIIQNNDGNEHSTTTVICPITKQNKEFSLTHVPINCLNESSIVLCEQIRTVDKLRLKRKMAEVSKETMKEVNKVIISHLNLQEE